MPDAPRKHRPRRAITGEARPSSARRGYGRPWRAIRAAYLMAHPVCQDCQRKPATHVDHETPREQGGTDDESNLQGLCHGCHSRKTASRDGGYGNQVKRGER